MKALADALKGNLRDFAIPRGRDFAARNEAFYSWVTARSASGMWPYTKIALESPGPVTVAIFEDGTRLQGANFASQDYLSLSRHPKIKDAARQAIEEYGVHSAGSSALMGNTRSSRDLESRVAAFLGYEHALVYPTGWAAGFGVVRGLVRPGDYVVADVFAHACLREGMHTATPNILNTPHVNNGEVRKALAQIRQKDRDAAILVITESLFSMDSDTADLAELQDMCTEHGALLLVDCAHDLGAMGATGRGMMEVQKVVGKVDMVMGSFSKTFASNGGFVATNSAAIKQVLRTYSGPQTFSNALSPVQCAVVLAAFDIIESAEGDMRRTSLRHNIEALRIQLQQAGFDLLGEASPIVPVLLQDVALQRLTAREILKHPVIVNFAEFPAVPLSQPRARLQVMTDHKPEHIEALVSSLAAAYAGAKSAKDELGILQPADSDAARKQLRVG
jgi:glycine C-acetyltransferase